jgi:hypothetical protein
VPERHAELLEIGLGQLRQDAQVDLVLAERLLYRSSPSPRN